MLKLNMKLIKSYVKLLVLQSRDLNAAVNIAREALRVYQSLSPEEAKGMLIIGDRDWEVPI
jgi:hypothetical protein